MKSKRSLRFFSNTLTAAGLALAVSACSTIYKDEWDQTSAAPDLDQPQQRSQALLEYCKKLHSRGDLNLAAGICNRAHEINPTDPAPLVQLARVMEDLQMTKSAEEAYRAALLLDPGHTDALYGLGKIYIDHQRYDLAMEPLEAAAHQDTDDPRIYNALGVIMDQQGQHAEAQAYYRQGLDHSPRNISLRNNLGLSMVLDGQPEAGLAMLREVAAEPAAGATAGRNLEMASQIAAKNVTAKTAPGMSALEPVESPVETKDETAGASRPSPHGELPPTRDLAKLEPASDAAQPQESRSKPLPLLRSDRDHHADKTAPATAPISPPRRRMSNAAPAAEADAPPPNARSLDLELADAMAMETTAAPARRTADAAAAANATGPADPARAEEIAEEIEEAAAAPATAEESAAPRDWSLAAQTVFATSRVAVPEPSQTAAPEPAPDMASNGGPHGELAVAPASAADEAEAQTRTAAISDTYGIDDEDTFYTAQLASFRSASRARKGWQILKDSAGDLLAGSDAFIVRADLGGEMGTYYRVRAGTMTDPAAAQQFCLDLQAKGFECLPVTASWLETNETLVDSICQSGSTGALCGTAKRSGVLRVGPPYARG